MFKDSPIKLYENGKSNLLKLQRAIAFDGSGINPDKLDEENNITIERIHITRISDSKNNSYYEIEALIMTENKEWDINYMVCSKDLIDYVMSHLDSYALIVKDNNRLNMINCIGIKEAEELLNITDENYRYNVPLSCYLQCSKEQRKRILRRLRHGQPPKLGTGIKRDFYPNSSDDIEMEYAICENIITRDIWSRIGCLMLDGTKSSLSSSQRSNIKRAIDFLLSYCFENEPKKISRDGLLKDLNNGFYGRDDIKKEIINAFTTERNREGIPKIICITGKNGLGKMLTAKTIAQATNDFYEFLSIDGSMHETDVFMGSSNIYENARHGKFAEMLYRIGNAGCLIIDGFKDAKSDIKSNLERALQTGELTDMMLQVPIPLGDMTFILVSEDSKDIPRKIYDISVKFNLEPYTDEERIKIGQSFILKDIKNEFGIEKTDITFTDEAENFLCNLYTVTSSMDEVVSNYRKLISKVVEDNKLYDKKEFKTTISMLYIESVFTTDNENSNIAKDMSSLENKFRENRFRFSKEEQKLISNLFEDYYALDENNGEKKVLKDRITFAVNFMSLINDEIKEDISDVITHIKYLLDREMYGHDESKKIVIRAIREGYLKYGDICGTLKLFMHGAAGTGKTSISRIIANALGIPFIKISLNGMSEVEIIKGFSSGFSKSKMGIIAEKLMDNGTRQAVILFDEVEKASVSVINALYDIVDPNEGQYYDNYLERYIPTDGLIMIAAGNDISKLPAAFMDRFEMVSLSGYTEHEREEIAKDYVYPRIVRELGLENRIVMDEEVIKLISDEYVHSGSVRPIEKKIKQVILDSLEGGGASLKGDSVIYISEEDVQKSLGSIPIKSGNRPCMDVYPAGVCNCLGVRGGLGNVFPVEVVKTPYLKKGRITGLPKKVMRDSIYNAEIFVSNFLGKKLDNISILFAEGAVPKDGPSAGVAIATALISVHTGLAVDKGVGFTGEIDVLGNVYAIGGEEEKLSAALSSGLNKVFIPYENFRVLRENEKLERFEGLSIIPVRHLSEVISNLFPTLPIENKLDSDENVLEMDKEDTFNGRTRQVI